MLRAESFRDRDRGSITEQDATDADFIEGTSLALPDASGGLVRRKKLSLEVEFVRQQFGIPL